MKIQFYTDDVSIPRFPRLKIKAWINQVVQGYHKEVGSISYFFCNDIKILEINREFLNHDYFTDIITFDYSEAASLSAEIYVSIDTVKSNAIKFNQHYINEFYRVLIHGVLHLCGFKDKTAKEQLAMRNYEEEALALLYANFLNQQEADTNEV